MQSIQRTILAWAAALATSVTAHAGSYVIDNFDHDDQSVSDTTVDGTAVSGSAGGRTLSINLTASVPLVQATAQVSSGYLDVSNGGGEISTVAVQWNLPGATVPPGATNVILRFEVVASDANPIQVEFRLNGGLMSTTSIPGATLNQAIDVPFTAAQLTGGGTLEVRIVGSNSWDATFDTIGLLWTDPAPSAVQNVPTLSAWGQLMLPVLMAGAAWRTRRRQRSGR